MSRPLPIMIDSGAYSAWTQGAQIDLDTYIAYCHGLLQNHPGATIINLDVIGDGQRSLDNWEEMRRQGLPDVVPIWHINTSEAFLVRYIDEVDYVGIGVLATKTLAWRKLVLDRVWSRFLIGPRRLPRVKVHGMGTTGIEALRRYPWRSVDSSACRKMAVYGTALIPQRSGVEWDFLRKPLKVVLTTQSKKRGEKGQHIETLTPPERERALQYFREMGFVLGKQRPGEKQKKRKQKYTYGMARKGRKQEYLNIEEIITLGLANNPNLRAMINLEFFSGYLRELGWPRPASPGVLPARGMLWNHQTDLDEIVEEQDLPRTIFYVSGDLKSTETYLLDHDYRDTRHAHVGILFSYWELATKGAVARRLDWIRKEQA